MHTDILREYMRSYNKPGNMKSFPILVSILAIAFVSSCASYCYVSTDVADNLSVDRCVHIASDEGSSVSFPFPVAGTWTVAEIRQPFVMDFYDASKTMTHSASVHAEKIENLHMGEKGEFNPLLRPVETLKKRFRWFYTYYDYKAVFSGLDELLPLSFEGYLTDEQQVLFFRGAGAPDSWNGIEMYTLLDDMNQSFVRWYSDAVYEVMCGIFRPYSTPGQYEVMCSVRDDYMKMNGRETVFAMKPDEFEDRLVAVAPENGFGMIYEANSVAVDEAYEREARITSCFETVFMYTISLPGRYVDGNALDFIEGNPVWKVDAFRLMCGDLTLEATSRKMNVWILILTFVVIAGVLQIFAKTYSRR